MLVIDSTIGSMYACFLKLSSSANRVKYDRVKVALYVPAGCQLLS